jgi:hypothetical protein
MRPRLTVANHTALMRQVNQQESMMDTKQFEHEQEVLLASDEAAFWMREADWAREPGTIEYAQRRAGMVREFQDKAYAAALKVQQLQQ